TPSRTTAADTGSAAAPYAAEGNGTRPEWIEVGIDFRGGRTYLGRMSRLLIALALVLAACTATVEPADPVETCVEADRRLWDWSCGACGACDAPSDDELRERCADFFGDDFAAIEA